MQADIQPAALKPVHLIVVEVVTHLTDPVYMGVLILTLSQSTASVRKLPKRKNISHNVAVYSNL